MIKTILAVLLSSTGLHAQTTDAQKFDVPVLCSKALAADIRESNHMLWRLSDELLDHGDAGALTAGVLSSPTAPYFYIDWAPWLLQNFARREYAEAGVMVQTAFVQRMMTRYAVGGTPDQLIQSASQAPAHYSDTAVALGQSVIDAYKTFPAHAGLALIKSKATLLCAQYLDVKCSKALNTLLDFMEPHLVPARAKGVVYAAQLSVILKLLTDAGYVQGTALLAKNILGRAQQPVMTPSHLNDDMLAAFQAAGLSPAEAESKTWDLLGFYGTRGASMTLFEDIVNKETAQLWAGLSLFSGTLGVLDHDTVASGKPYSYPAEVTTQCAFSRPYHFWMAAQLAHYLRTKGFSARTSVIATHILAKLYEFAAAHGTRDPNRVYSEPFFSSYQNSIQAAIAFNDAGALWGAGERGSKLNIDAGLARMFKKAKALPQMSKEDFDKGLKDDLTRYQWFNRLIAPEAYLELL